MVVLNTKYEGHTPGPWEWKTTPGSDHERCTVYVKDGHAVARHVLPADARLIADAPVLLKTVERLTAILQQAEKHLTTAQLVAMQAALEGS